MTVELNPLATMTLQMAAPLVMPGTPAGTRVVVEFTGVTFEGERLRGTRRGPAGDWLTVGPEGTAVLDARFCLETHDGALVYVTGAGRTDGQGFAKGAATYFVFGFETADPRYAWLNRVHAVAKGHASGSIATFDVLEVR